MIINKLTKESLEELSKIKGEDNWVKDFRQESLKIFQELPMPNFGPKVTVDLDKITYYTN